MSILSALLLISPLTTVDIDLKVGLPDLKVIYSNQEIIKAFKPTSQDDSELVVSHFLGRSRAYGFKEFNFVIRANNR